VTAVLKTVKEFLFPYFFTDVRDILYRRSPCKAVGDCVRPENLCTESHIYVFTYRRNEILHVFLHPCRIWIKFGKGNVKKPVRSCEFRKNRRCQSLHLAVRSRISETILPLPPYAFMAWRGSLSSTFYILTHTHTHTHTHTNVTLRIA
jgi:hypothetical protein